MPDANMEMHKSRVAMVLRAHTHRHGKCLWEHTAVKHASISALCGANQRHRQYCIKFEVHVLNTALAVAEISQPVSNITLLEQPASTHKLVPT